MSAQTNTKTSPGADFAKVKAPWLPPRWFIRLAWAYHRAYFRVTGGRRGLFGSLRREKGDAIVTTVGRKTGKSRSVILGLRRWSDLVTLAMNGWGSPEPAWWLNMQAKPVVGVELKDCARTCLGHAAKGEERDRLWAQWRDHGHGENLDAWASHRSGETAVVVLEPVKS